MGARLVQGAGAGRREAGRGPERDGWGWGLRGGGTQAGLRGGKEAGRGVSARTRENQMIREKEPEAGEGPRLSWGILAGDQGGERGRGAEYGWSWGCYSGRWSGLGRRTWSRWPGLGGCQAPGSSFPSSKLNKMTVLSHI